MLLVDGLDAAFVGIVTRPPNEKTLAVYDIEVVLQILMERDGIDRLGAMEFYEVNIASSYVGEGPPIFLERMP